MKSWEDNGGRDQDKGSKFVVLKTNIYVEKVEQKINGSSFDKLNSDPSSESKQKVIDLIEKWSDKIKENWKEFVEPGNYNAGKKYGMVKTHNIYNPVRVNTSGCNTSIEKLSILVEKILYPTADKLHSQIKDTNDMLDIIDHVLVSFDVANVFPNIDSKSGLKSVKNVLFDNNFDPDSTKCIIDALEICLIIKVFYRKMI